MHSTGQHNRAAWAHGHDQIKRQGTTQGRRNPPCYKRRKTVSRRMGLGGSFDTPEGIQYTIPFSEPPEMCRMEGIVWPFACTTPYLPACVPACTQTRTLSQDEKFPSTFHYQKHLPRQKPPVKPVSPLHPPLPTALALMPLWL